MRLFFRRENLSEVLSASLFNSTCTHLLLCSQDSGSEYSEIIQFRYPTLSQQLP